MPDLLRAVLRKHEDNLLESLLVNKYQYGATLITVASPALGKLDVVNMDSKIEHFRKKCLLLNKYSAAVVDGCLRLSCIQKLLHLDSRASKNLHSPFG